MFYSGVIHIGISDHSLISVVGKFVIPKHVRNVKNFSEKDFLFDLSQIPWEKRLLQTQTYAGSSGNLFFLKLQNTYAGSSGNLFF